jgi:hypothetical protein
MSVKRFVRSLLLTSALLGAIPVAATPAAAQGSGGECLEWGRNPASGEIICLAWSNTDPPSDGGGNGGGAHGGGAPAECVWGDTVIPCTRSDTAGVWSAGQSCYLAALSPQPAPEHPAWSGNYPDGAIYGCYNPYIPIGTRYMEFWLADPPPGVVIDPAVLAEQAVARMQLTAINPQIAPRPLSDDADSMGLVGLPVWLWTDPTPTTWGPNSASASAGGTTVTATAHVERVEWSMGDGTVVTCTSTGTPYDPSYGVERMSPDCGHRYEITSGGQAGQVFTITATSYWVANWSGGGQSGTIEVDFSTSEQVRIGEMQVLRTG